MKKIVGIIAAVAMAASVFALDISASLRFNGDLFNIDFADGAAPKLFNLEQPKAQKPHGQTGIDLTVSGDQAGATLNLGNGYGGKTGLNYEGFSLWVKPIDMLKISFGGVDYNINKETIDYAGCINSAGGNGFAFDLMPIEGLSFSFVMAPDFGNPWITVGKSVAQTAFYAKYSADFGTIGAAWIYSAKTYDSKADNSNNPSAAPDYNRFSLGYSNTFGDVSMFADVAFGIIGDDDAAKLADTSAWDLVVDAFVKYNKDSFGIAGYLCYTNWLALSHAASKANAKPEDSFGICNDLSIKAKLTYQLDAVGIYLYAKVADVMLAKGEDLNLTINPGVTFNVGAAGFDIGVKISNIGGDPVNLSVPFKVSIGF